MGDVNGGVYPPFVVADCADFVVEVAGEERHPHAGQSVTFRGGVTWPQMKRGLRLDALERAGGPSKLRGDDLAEYVALFEESVNDLVAGIVEWTWENGAGEAYPSPPSLATVMELDLAEVYYLFARYHGGTSSGEEPPSTSS